MENSWNKKKKSPKTNTILSTLRLPIQVLTKLPLPCSTAITPQSHRSIEQLTLFCIMSVFPSLCSIEQPSVFRMMSVFPDFCSDIFLLHIIYNFFCLFCLHYTVINLLYRKFTYKRYLFFTDLCLLFCFHFIANPTAVTPFTLVSILPIYYYFLCILLEIKLGHVWMLINLWIVDKERLLTKLWHLIIIIFMKVIFRIQ